MNPGFVLRSGWNGGWPGGLWVNDHGMDRTSLAISRRFWRPLECANGRGVTPDLVDSRAALDMWFRSCYLLLPTAGHGGDGDTSTLGLLNHVFFTLGKRVGVILKVVQQVSGALDSSMREMRRYGWSSMWRGWSLTRQTTRRILALTLGVRLSRILADPVPLWRGSETCHEWDTSLVKHSGWNGMLESCNVNSSWNVTWCCLRVGESKGSCRNSGMHCSDVIPGPVRHARYV